MYAVLIVEQDFIVQGGDPTGTGRGGQSIYNNGYVFFHSNSLFYEFH